MRPNTFSLAASAVVLNDWSADVKSHPNASGRPRIGLDYSSRPVESRRLPDETTAESDSWVSVGSPCPFHAACRHGRSLFLVVPPHRSSGDLDRAGAPTRLSAALFHRNARPFLLCLLRCRQRSPR